MGHAKLWSESLLEARFASPTSAGVLFSMLAAAGLAATWVFQKARVLAIFDDLDTILFMVPLKMLMVGLRWQLGVIVVLIGTLLWLAWRFMHALRWPTAWPFVMAYAAGITACSSLACTSSATIHLEVLLPAFVLGCMLHRPPGVDVHAHDAVEGHEEGPGRTGRAARRHHRLGVLHGAGRPVDAADPGGSAWLSRSGSTPASHQKSSPRSMNSPAGA